MEATIHKAIITRAERQILTFSMLLHWLTACLSDSTLRVAKITVSSQIWSEHRFTSCCWKVPKLTQVPFSISDRQKEHIEPWLQFVSHLLETPDDKLPQVMSISYGVNEQVVPKAYAKKICRMFGQLAARGMSIIVASGDTGPGLSCQSNDGTNTTKYLPDFPATCPYVTAVGGTEGKGPEKAMNYSSGGFSEYWTRPGWQDAAVTEYLGGIGDKHKKYYNSNGRAYPDVAAQGVQFPIFNHGKIEYAGGTRYVDLLQAQTNRTMKGHGDGFAQFIDSFVSASAPLFASMIALINDCRLKRGKPALGFLNPWLYRVGHQAFTE